MRQTSQRRILMQKVFAQHKHFDADQLIEQLPKKGQPGYVSRPTVYRTLSEFVDSGLLRKFELEGRSVYEHDYGYPQHDHFFCTRCQKLIEFVNPRVVELRDEVAEQHDFQVRNHRLIISGICHQCRASRRRKRRRVDLI
jgi:Fur family ferric uptake transcriptional regulator